MRAQQRACGVLSSMPDGSRRGLTVKEVLCLGWHVLHARRRIL